MDILANAIHFIFKNMKFCFSSSFGFLLQCMGFFFLAAQPGGSPKSGGNSAEESPLICPDTGDVR
jgi:hypothetical protein